ncbi:endochitinase [Teleopsis dalmanni]|uniref:endochitinase n=1 Tax=Teleopsis dalmanni TaxID=139649 RepID=UPI0018CE8200|nr:endochitinase [Teleopsis dalmanni]
MDAQNCVVGKCPPCHCSIVTTTPTPTTTTDPTTTDDPYKTCQNHEHGYRFPNKDHCRLFWICVEGTPVQQFCQIGMWYDREKFVCDFPKNVRNCPANKD